MFIHLGWLLLDKPVVWDNKINLGTVLETGVMIASAGAVWGGMKQKLKSMSEAHGALKDRLDDQENYFRQRMDKQDDILRTVSDTLSELKGIVKTTASRRAS